MKKNGIIFTLALALLLCGCMNLNPEDTILPEPLQTDTNPTTELTTQPTSSVTTEPVQTTIPTEPETSAHQQDFTEYYTLLEQPIYQTEYDIYTLKDVTLCPFERPEELVLSVVFYRGFHSVCYRWDQLGEAEAVFVAEQCDIYGDPQKRPTETLNTVLERMVGLTMDSFIERIPKSWAYYPETDCYYTTHGDTLVPGEIKIHQVEITNDGTLLITYSPANHFVYIEKDSTQEIIKVSKMLLTLRPGEDGQYRAVSNQIVEPYEN